MSNAEARYDCTNPSDQLTIAGNHKITEAKFNSMVSAFFGPSTPVPTVITWADINNLIAEADCTTSRLRFSMDENDLMSNDIGVELVEMLEVFRYYSIPLFKGIKQMMDVEEFHFYKARKDDSQYDIVFKAVNGGTVKFFDLSNEVP